MQDLQPEAAIRIWREIQQFCDRASSICFLGSKELPFITVFRIEGRLLLAAALRPCLSVSSELSPDGSIRPTFAGMGMLLTAVAALAGYIPA